MKHHINEKIVTNTSVYKLTLIDNAKFDFLFFEIWLAILHINLYRHFVISWPILTDKTPKESSEWQQFPCENSLTVSKWIIWHMPHISVVTWHRTLGTKQGVPDQMTLIRGGERPPSVSLSSRRYKTKCPPWNYCA